MPRWRAEEGRGAGGGDDEEKSPPLRTHVSGLLTCGAEATWGRAVREGEVESAPVCGGVEASLAGSPPSRDVIRREASRPHVVASPPPPRLLLSCGSRPLFLSFLEAPVPLMGLGGPTARPGGGGVAAGQPATEDGTDLLVQELLPRWRWHIPRSFTLSVSLACLDVCKGTCTALSPLSASHGRRHRSGRWPAMVGTGMPGGESRRAGMQHLLARQW